LPPPIFSGGCDAISTNLVSTGKEVKEFEEKQGLW
jgi:hypothetical protein